MLLGIDRVIVPVDLDGRERLSHELVEAGLVYAGDTGLDDHPTADGHFALEGGGFVELVWERHDGASPFRMLFEDNPRVAGIGFTTDDFDADRQPFADEARGWLWERRPGDNRTTRSAGPAPVGEEDPYLFLIDSPKLPYVDEGAAGRLTEVLVEGTAASECGRRVAASLGLSLDEDRFTVGDTTVRFDQTGSVPIATSLTIEGARTAHEIPLTRGVIRFKP